MIVTARANVCVCVCRAKQQAKLTNTNLLLLCRFSRARRCVNGRCTTALGVAGFLLFRCHPQPVNIVSDIMQKDISRAQIYITLCSQTRTHTNTREISLNTRNIARTFLEVFCFLLRGLLVSCYLRLLLVTCGLCFGSEIPLLVSGFFIRGSCVQQSEALVRNADTRS